MWDWFNFMWSEWSGWRIKIWLVILNEWYNMIFRLIQQYAIRKIISFRRWVFCACVQRLYVPVKSAKKSRIPWIYWLLTLLPLSSPPMPRALLHYNNPPGGTFHYIIPAWINGPTSLVPVEPLHATKLLQFLSQSPRCTISCHRLLQQLSLQQHQPLLRNRTIGNERIC